MHRKYVAGVVALVPAGVVAALLLGGSAGAGNACPSNMQVSPSSGHIGSVFTIKGKHMGGVDSVWLRQTIDDKVNNGFAPIVAVGPGFVKAKVPKDPNLDTNPNPVEVDGNGGCFAPDEGRIVFTRNNFQVVP